MKMPIKETEKKEKQGMDKIKKLVREMRKTWAKRRRESIESKLYELKGKIESLAEQSGLLYFLVNVCWQKSMEVEEIIKKANGIIVGVSIESCLAYYDIWILPPGSIIRRRSSKRTNGMLPDENQIETILIELPTREKVKYIDFLPGKHCGRFIKG
jgi:hypothetical protein